MAKVSGSFEVPDELIVRKITGRIGAEAWWAQTRSDLRCDALEALRGEAGRIDSTVIAAELSTRPTWGMPLTGSARWCGRDAS